MTLIHMDNCSFEEKQKQSTDPVLSNEGKTLMILVFLEN